MKFSNIIVTLTALVPVSAFARDVAAPAVVAPAVVAPAAAVKFSTATPIEQLVADPKAKVVLDADLPGVTTHAMYDQFKSMSLVELQPLSKGKITDLALAKIASDLAAIK